ELEERPVGADPRVGHDAVERAEALDDLRGGGEDRVAIAHVARHAERVGQAERGARPREQGDLRPALGEGAGDRGTDAAARPRHQGDARRQRGWRLHYTRPACRRLLPVMASMITASSSTAPVTMNLSSDGRASWSIPLEIDPMTSAPSSADHTVPR